MLFFINEPCKFLAFTDWSSRPCWALFRFSHKFTHKSFWSWKQCELCVTMQLCK